MDNKDQSDLKMLKSFISYVALPPENKGYLKEEARGFIREREIGRKPKPKVVTKVSRKTAILTAISIQIALIVTLLIIDIEEFLYKEELEEIELSKDTDLEIYTKENIYYVRGLSVANEVSQELVLFKNKEGLKKYLSAKTAEDSK